MAMNRWRCEHPGCTREVVGCGGAIGLRAIGWYFRPAPVILCPAHRPDPIATRAPLHDPDDNDDALCRLCRADLEAYRWQLLMGGRPEDDYDAALVAARAAGDILPVIGAAAAEG